MMEPEENGFSRIFHRRKKPHRQPSSAFQFNTFVISTLLLHKIHLYETNKTAPRRFQSAGDVPAIISSLTQRDKLNLREGSSRLMMLYSVHVEIDRHILSNEIR